MLKTFSILSAAMKGPAHLFLNRGDCMGATPVEPLSIVALEPGGPAASSGRLSVGDKLLAVDDWDCKQQVSTSD